MKFERGEIAFQVGINQFSDLTNDEFVKMYLSEPLDLEKEQNIDTCAGPQAKSQTRDKFDWTSSFANPVRDQGKCAASYAFAAAASVENVRWISTGFKTVLSVQQIVDCSESYGN